MRARLAAHLAAKGERRLATPLGELVLDAAAGAGAASAIARFFEDEPETLAWIEGLPAGTVLRDVGANIGIYACYAALRPGVRVVAIEPDPVNFAALVANIERNGVGERIVPLCLAWAARTSIAPLFARDREAGAAGRALGAPRDHGVSFAPAAMISVPAFRAEALAAVLGLPPPSHLKIDVDGLAGDVLAGFGAPLDEVTNVPVEVEGENAADPAFIESPLHAAGLVPIPLPGPRMSGLNRLYGRRAREAEEGA